MSRALKYAVAGFAFWLASMAHAGPKTPNLWLWQLVVSVPDARCLTDGEQAVLRRTDGVEVQTVARVKVMHVNRREGIVTFGER